MTQIISYPYYYLQSDWHESKNNEKIWLYTKNDNNSNDVDNETIKRKHYNLKILNDLNIINENQNQNDFSIINYSKKCLTIQDKQSKVTHRFLPPTKIFTSIHQKSIQCLDVAPIGIAVSASTDGTMKVWDTLENQMKLELKGHLSDVNKCKFFPSNEVILSAGSDMLIKIWSAINGCCPVTLQGHHRSVNDLAIIDRGRNIISVGSDGLVKLWNVSKQICIENLYDLVNTKQDCSAINACQIQTLNQNNGLDKFPDFGERTDPINEDCIGTENKLLLFATESGFVYGLDVHSKKIVFEINLQSPVNCITFINNDNNGLNFIAGTTNGDINEFDLRKTQQPIKCWQLNQTSVTNLLSIKKPFNGIVASRMDGSVNFLYDNLKEIVHLTGSDCDPIYQLAYDNKFIYTACRDGKVRQYFLNNAFE